MTDDEIIKAIENCINEYDKFGITVDNNRIDKLVLDLINRQQAKIEALQMDNEQLHSDVTNANMNLEHQQAEIERLTVENMLTMSERNAFLTSFYEVSKQLKIAKSEAVKEFAERYAENFIVLFNLNYGQTEAARELRKRIVKEMVGDNNG